MTPELVAVDIGNSVVKCGLFGPAAAPACDVLDEPAELVEAPLDDPSRLGGRLAERFAARGVERWSGAWFVSSVNRPAAKRLLDWLAAARPQDSVRLLDHRDVPLTIDVDFPERVGFDRLATATAAAALRNVGEAAIVVDAGTALKVHAVSAAGAFVGGAILPGFRMAARSLQAGTDLLPFVDASLNMTPPAVLGRNTQGAIESGLYWGAVGAVRELIERMRSELGRPTTPVFVTGGDARGLGALIDHGVRFVPHLCLRGVAQIARSISSVGRRSTGADDAERRECQERREHAE